MLNLGSVFFNIQADARKLRAVSGVMKKFGQTAEGQQKKLGKFAKTMRDLESASVLAVGPLSGLGARIRAIGSIAGRSTLKIVAFLAGLTAMGVALFKISKLAITSRKEFQRISAALIVAAGNSDTAAQEFEFIARVSEKMGLDLRTAGSEFAKMAVSTSRAGISAEDTRIIFEGLSAASSALKLDADATSGAFRAFNQIASKGKVQAEELVGQLAERLPGALQLAAKGMGVTTVALLDMVRKGEVLAVDFLPALGKELKRAFGASGQRAAKELQGTINNLSNTMFKFGIVFDDAVGVSETYRGVITGITNAVKFLTRNLDDLITGLGTVLGLMLGLAGPAIFRGIQALGTVVVALTVKVRALAVAMLAIPGLGLVGILIRIATVVAAAAAGFLLFSNATDKVRRSVNKLIEGNRRFLNSITLVNQATVDATKLRVAAIQKQIEALLILTKAEEAALAFRAIGGAVKEKDLPAFLQIREDKVKFIADLVKEVEKLQEVLTRPVTSFGAAKLLPDDKGSKKFIREMLRSIATIDKFNLKLAELDAQTKALAAGPEVFRSFDKLQKRAKIIEGVRKALEGTKLEVDEIKEAMDRFTVAMDRNFEAQERFNRIKAIVTEVSDAFEAGFNNIGRSITDALVKGGSEALKFRDIMLGVISEIAQAILRIALIRPAVAGLEGFLSRILGGVGGVGVGASDAGTPGAKGLVMGAGRVKKFGKGGVLQGPTFFPASNALGGEAGDEALLPLKRNARGELGVTSAGQANVMVLVNITNTTDSSVTANSRESANGSTELTILIDKAVAGSIKSGGETFQAIRNTFGISQQVTGR